ncbi:hypothetical protein EYF80_060160 [Liparis tanakae]|uniref:Uncharacterized protein n=1 Tax=Liparis tanakae TaxID=230148 RepID=A0A4Z2EM94_9TELE|nr:hypothetical protein EYF80_060160 [Liparis tanakae]
METSERRGIRETLVLKATRDTKGFTDFKELRRIKGHKVERKAPSGLQVKWVPKAEPPLNHVISPQGHVGVPGKQGSKGDVGIQGIQDVKGGQGEKGVKGPKGKVSCGSFVRAALTHVIFLEHTRTQKSWYTLCTSLEEYV